MNLLKSEIKWVEQPFGRYQVVKGLLPRLWDSIAWAITESYLRVKRVLKVGNISRALRVIQNRKEVL